MLNETKYRLYTLFLENGPSPLASVVDQLARVCCAQCIVFNSLEIMGLWRWLVRVISLNSQKLN